MQDHPSIKALGSYILEKSSSNAALYSHLQGLFSQTENHAGLVICERLINMPVETVPPMYRMLTEELKTAISQVRLTPRYFTTSPKFNLHSERTIQIHGSNLHLKNLPSNRTGGVFPDQQYDSQIFHKKAVKEGSEAAGGGEAF